jgi:hypothetical protein
MLTASLFTDWIFTGYIMKKILILILAALLFSVPAFAANITLLKRTVQVTPQRFLRYWKDPKAAEPVYDTYSWVPKIQFDVIGPISGGSKIYVEFDTPEGKPWMKYNMQTPELEDGEYSSDNLSAYLFYNGKQISSTKMGGQGSAGDARPIIHDGDDSHELRWELWRFSFVNARAFADPSAYPNALILSKNPGNYEIKVLMDGELARAAAFTIGADGMFVNNGVADKNGFGALGLVMPVRIIPTKEKIGNLTNWKTDAFYGNPLTGFTAQ